MSVGIYDRSNCVRKLILLILLLISVQVLAQVDGSLRITADNALQLQSVSQINFSDYDIEMQSGWFEVGIENVITTTETQPLWYDTGEILLNFVTISSSQEIITWNEEQGLLNRYHVTNAEGDVLPIIDIDLNQKRVISLHSDGSHFVVGLNSADSENDEPTSVVDFPVNELGDSPIDIWTDCYGSFVMCDLTVSAEVLSDTPYVTEFLYNYEQGAGQFTPEQLVFVTPYPLGNDEEAVVRIGRIPAPNVVTSSLNGIVKLWDMWTDDPLYEVDNGTGEPSVFGNINASATHLVWRDNANETLYLLNFETGENREIAALNGDYAQWYFLSNDASVIIAVNLGGEPNVVVWDTETGERTDLGYYRDCARPQPDMARLTEDGSTLIIGCDTGLDIWRIHEEG